MRLRGSDRQGRAGFSKKDFAAPVRQRPDAFGGQRTLRPDIAAGLELIAMDWLRKSRRIPVGARSRLGAAFG
jgi:hypothetical protein